MVSAVKALAVYDFYVNPVESYKYAAAPKL
jgi:hypothetical protein